MQWPLLTLCCCLLASPVVLGSPIGQEVDEPTVQQQHHQLLGAKECTWGPSYWCYNITNAKGCNAVKHCIQTVWEKHAVPEDHDSICDICLDMVQQARDQLRSNMTQEDLKAVFEGSCKLIPIKVVAKECIKLADDFIPELVEALSSQMNPQAVCSVAGLCNNAAIDRMLEAEATQKRLAVVPLASAANEFTCTKCNSIGGIIAQKFHSADRDSVLEAMLRQCGQMSSFSDACSSIVITYFEEIYANLKNTLNRETICHMSGVCAAQFHQHDDVAEEAVSVEQLQKSMSPVESVKDDIPCELCKQLVHHLKELLIANTTEIEFKQVLEGLCKQTKSFQSECLSIVDNYYIQIYHTLVTDLNENEACCAIAICPRGLAARAALTAGIAPLLPAVPAAHLDVHITAKPRLTKKQYLGQGEPKLSTSQIASAQLPIDTLMASPNANRLVEGGVLCPVCEFVTNFVATELADDTVDESIKILVKNSCSVISPLLKPMCDMFIDTYGDAVIALFAEVVQPDHICPAMLMCAAAPPKDVEVMSRIDADGITVNGQTGTEKCPMCLFAVAQAQAAVKSDKSVDNIKSVLNRLCVHLPTKMQLECNDFVETYTKELVRMLANDFSAEAICVQLQLCDPKKSSKPLNLVPIASEFGGDIETNEISDSTFNGIEVGSIVIDNRLSPNCLLCEEVVKEVEKHISNKKSRDQIKKSLERVCSRLHKIQAKCSALVQKYGDKLVDLIMGEFTPKQICRTLGQCIVMMEVEMVPTNNQQQITSAADDFFVPNIEHERFDGNTAYIHANGPNPTICVICQTIMTKLEDELKDASTQKQIEDTVKKICHKLPKSYDTPCTNFVDSYGAMVITLLDTTPPKEICGHLSLCSPPPITETKLDVLECAVCHAATQQMIRVIEDPKTERSIEHVVEKVCPWLPGKYNASCVKLIEIYGHSMMTIISRGELQTVCTQIGMCFADEYASFAQVVSTVGQ